MMAPIKTTGLSGSEKSEIRSNFGRRTDEYISKAAMDLAPLAMVADDAVIAMARKNKQNSSSSSSRT